VAALSAVDFVADCTVEGLLHSPELGEILRGGTRVLMISNEHPENTERWPHDPGLADRVATGAAIYGTITLSANETIELGGGQEAVIGFAASQSITKST